MIASDGIHSSGTSLQNALHDLHKLGVDTVGISGISQLKDLNKLTTILKDAGVANLGLQSDELLGKDGQPTDLFKAFETHDWIQNGVDVALEINNSTPTADIATSGLSDNAALNEILNGIQLTGGETWGSLLQTLSDAGLGRIEVESKASVHITDDLSAALYESGMLHALPDAYIEIDVAASTKLLSTSLKAMADLGVDKVHASDMVYVKLGVTANELSGIHDLFSAFGLDSKAAAGKALFDNSGKGAGLVLDDATAKALGIVSQHIDEAKVADLVQQLSKLGITEVDVVHVHDGAESHQVDVFQIQPVSGVVAQAPILTEVKLLGVNEDVSHAFDQDILNKPKT